MRVTAIVVLLSILGACSPGAGTTSTTSSVTTTTSTTNVTTTTSTVADTTISSSPATTVPAADVIVEGGTDEVPELTVVGPDTFTYAIGDAVEISILSSVDDEIHVHGYDLHFDAVAGQVTVVGFEADVPGIFEVELEGHGKLLFDIEVGG